MNETLGHDDIVSKIKDIKLWFEQRAIDMPDHISEIIEHIEQMPQYIELENLKGGDCSQQIVESRYLEFIRNYFNPENDLLKKCKINLSILSRTVNLKW